MKIQGFFHRLNLRIFYPGIYQESKSRNFLVPGFSDPGIPRDIPGLGYPADIPSQSLLSEGVETKQTIPHTLISGQTHIIQKRDEVSLDPLDQALNKEFLEK